MADSQGNVAGVTNSSGAVTGTAQFTPFSVPLNTSGSGLWAFAAAGVAGVQTLPGGALLGGSGLTPAMLLRGKPTGNGGFLGGGGLWEPDLGQAQSVAERASILGMDPADYAERINNQIAAQLWPVQGMVPGITRPLDPSHPKAGLCNDGDILCLWFHGDEEAYQNWVAGGIYSPMTGGRPGGKWLDLLGFSAFEFMCGAGGGRSNQPTQLELDCGGGGGGGGGGVVPPIGPRGGRAIAPRAPTLFDNAGIRVTEHFRAELAIRVRQGRLTERQALDAYNHGRLFYDPKEGTYVHHDSKSGVSVVTLGAPSGGIPHTVFRGNPSPRWVPVRFR